MDDSLTHMAAVQAAVKTDHVKLEDMGMEHGSPLSPALVSPSYAAMLARLPSDPAGMLHHALSLGTLLQGSGGSLSLLSDFSDLGADTAMLSAVSGAMPCDWSA